MRRGMRLHACRRGSTACFRHRRRYCSSAAAELGLQRPGVRLLELGAGTGWLGCTLARNMGQAALVCLTEQLDGLPHLQRNVDTNRARGLPLDHVRVQPCDWLQYAPTEGGSAGTADVAGSNGLHSSSQQPPGVQGAAGTGSCRAARDHSDGGSTGELPLHEAAAAAAQAAVGAGAGPGQHPAAAPQDLAAVGWDFIVGSDLIYNEVGSRCLPRVLAALAGSTTCVLYCHTKHRYDLLDAEFFEQLAACGLEAWEGAGCR